MQNLSQKAYYVQARPQYHARETSGFINFVIVMSVLLIFLTIGGAFAKTMLDDIIQKANARPFLFGRQGILVGGDSARH